MNEWELKFLVAQFWYLSQRQIKLNTSLQEVLKCMCFVLRVFTINNVPMTCLALVASSVLLSLHITSSYMLWPFWATIREDVIEKERCHNTSVCHHQKVQLLQV